ncbi:hypothetical protein FB550_10731 [Neobacillus bataviensis]|uniref:Uncharacterized protein n=1 Tax=Neobacillus bataviensis TaxID=220685 RepID=A0A561D7I3_9BACI|nr:hypothetical protein [Neobacillus bataviensis]TWD99396.1 hypothetical protein FB550_10731 [Neobacillus bataviensis]
MENNSRLIFIGEIINSQEIRITRKPSIYDAFLLSEKSFSTFPSSMNPSYQSVPLVEQANISIHINCYHIILSYQHNSLQIAESSKILTEEEVIEVFTNFIVKKGDRITFLGTSPHRKTRPRKKKKERILAVEKPVPVTVNGIFTV